MSHQYKIIKKPKSHLRAHNIQKRNPILKKLGIRCEFTDQIGVDFQFPQLEIGINFLSLTYHLKKSFELPLRLAHSKKMSTENSGRTMYLCLILDKEDSDGSEYVPELTLMALEYSFRLLIFDSSEELIDFMKNLNTQIAKRLKK